MRKLATSGARVTAALAALTFSAAACGTDTMNPEGPKAGAGDPVELEIAALGVQIPSCGTPGYDSATKTLTLDVVAGAPLILSVKAGAFTANGYSCDAAFGTITRGIRTTEVMKLIINGTTGADKVILDFLPGTFGTQLFASTGAGINVDFSQVNSPNTLVDSFMIRGSTLPETHRFAQVGTPATQYVIEMTNDKKVDLNLATAAGNEPVALTMSMGAGNDIVNANPAAADIVKLADGTAFTTWIPMSTAVIAYGGPGDDKFTSGPGDDQFYGGPGKDTFYTSSGATADGADTYSGDEDIDTMDYSGRTGNLHVDVGPMTPSVEGTVDLADPTLYGATGSLKDKQVVFLMDGAITRVDLATPASPKDVLSAINTQANTDFGTTGAVYAKLANRNHLVLSSLTNVPQVSYVQIEDDVPAATLAGAEATLNLTASATPTASVASSSPTVPATVAAALPGKRLVAQVNGVYCTVTFGATADAAAAATQINTAFNTCLGTSAVVYATSATETLTIAPPGGAVNVLTGTDAHGLIVTPAAGNGAEGILGLTVSRKAVTSVTTTSIATLASGALNGKRLVLLVNGRRVAIPFGTEADETAVASTIETAIDAAAGAGTYATPNTTLHTVSIAATSLLVQDGAAGYPVPVPAVSAPKAEGVIGWSTGVAAAGTVASGTGDLSQASTLAALADTRLVLRFTDSADATAETFVEVRFGASVANTAAALTAINTAINTALGSNTVASDTNSADHLELDATAISATTQVQVLDGQLSLTSANSLLGLTVMTKSDTIDADDGLAGENDDVQGSIESIIGGDGDDELFGNELRNSIKGGDGNDVIAAGGNTTACTSTRDGDSLLGEAGDDTFLVPMFDCGVSMVGGTGSNAIDLSGRGNAVTLKANGLVDDGETDEHMNIGTDVRTLIGGFGNDTLLGGTGEDTLRGGPGADSMNGGAGLDTVDYSSSAVGVNVTLCFDTTASPTCAANDGASGEGDTVNLVERIVGSSFDDILSGAAAPLKANLMIQGGAGDDLLEGGIESDELWGDDGDDLLEGGAGDDQLSGDNGDDVLNGGDGYGDICLGDASDTTPNVYCEL